MNINDNMLDMLVPSNLSKVRRYRFMPHAIEIGGAYWTKNFKVKFQIMCFFTHKEKRLINDHRDSKGVRIGTSINDPDRKTKYKNVEPKFLIMYLFEKPFSSK